MIIVYGDSKGCLTCAILKVALKDCKVPYRFYELNDDYTIDELQELYPHFDTVPFILNNGNEITLAELERIIYDTDSTWHS